MADSTPLMTVVVTIYNLGHFLAPCLTSLRDQTYQDYEVLLVDDHSTDESATVADQWAQQETNFTVTHLSKHSGVSVARNYGIEHANGAIIVFVDGDDKCEPAYLATFAEGLADPNVDLVTVGSSWGGWARGAVRQLSGWHEISQADMLAEATEHGTQIGGYTWNKAFRMSVINQLKLRFDTSLALAEDLLFTAEYEAGATHKFLFNPAILYDKVSRPGSTIHSATRQMRSREWEIDQRIDDLRNHLA